MTRSLIIGAITGAIILGALWALAGTFVRGIGRAGASVQAGWLGGTVVDNDPLMAYRWGGIGLAAGALLGGSIGALCRNVPGRKGGLIIGALVAIAGLALSMLLVIMKTGVEVLADFGMAPALLAMAGISLIGSLIGMAAQFFIRSLGIRRD